MTTEKREGDENSNIDLLVIPKTTYILELLQKAGYRMTSPENSNVEKTYYVISVDDNIDEITKLLDSSVSSSVTDPQKGRMIENTFNSFFKTEVEKEEPKDTFGSTLKGTQLDGYFNKSPKK